MKAPSWLGLHGLELRARDPRALARRLRHILGWKTIASSGREVVLGTGAEMFVTVRADRDAGDSVRIDAIHVAVEDLPSSRPARGDAWGGDSWTKQAGDLSITIRAFRRPPRRKWRLPRTSR